MAGFLLVAIVHRALRGRTRRLAEALGGPELSSVFDTRLRFLRRVIEAAIIIVALALAIGQFTSLDRLASTVLASSAIAAAVVGFAARQMLANAIAGMVLAVTQPLRIGDLVTFEDETGTVEDVTLTYTWLRTGADARLIIPNERLAAGMLRNDSIRSTRPRRSPRSRRSRTTARRASPRSPTPASGCRWPVRRWRRRSASNAKGSCERRRCGHCARQGVGGTAANPDLP